MISFQNLTRLKKHFREYQRRPSKHFFDEAVPETLKAQYFASVIFEPKLKEKFRLITFILGYTFHAISRERALQA